MRIAFVGRAGSGKTTLANYLVSKYGFVRLSFATKIKEFAEQILQAPIDKFNPSHRRFLQELGLLAREVDPNVWIKWIDREMARLEGRDIVIDDCRFYDESVFLRSKGFVLIRLKGRAYDMPTNLMSHRSETEMDTIKCDYELDASKPLDEELADLERIIEELRAKSLNREAEN